MDICEGLGVDSGQLGIFDYTHFQNDLQFNGPEYTMTHNFNSLFYNVCCEITLYRMHAGVIPYGCVSASGFGDGVYYAYIFYDNNEVIAVEVIFIEDDEEEFTEDCND